MSRVRRSAAFALIAAQFFAACLDNLARESGGGVLGSAILGGGALVLSGVGGALADRVGSSLLVRGLHGFAFAAAVVTAVGLASGRQDLFFAGLIGLSLRAALFGPLKYALLPRLFDETEAVGASGLVAASTMIAALVGTALAQSTADGPRMAFYLVWAGALAMVGAWLVPDVQPGRPEARIEPIGASIDAIRAARAYRPVWLSILGISWLWALGVVVVAIVPALDWPPGRIPVLLAAGAVAGAAVAHLLSARRVELGIVPIGSLFISIGALLVPIGSASGGGLFVLAFGGGLFAVPLYAFVAWRSPVDRRGAVIGGNNIVNGVAMLVAAAVMAAVDRFGIGPAWVFVGIAAVNAAVAIYVYATVPEFMLRLVAWALANVIYRVRVDGLQNIPVDGPCVVIANHVTFVDWMLLAGTVPRPGRYVMYAGYYDTPFIGFMARQARVIPIASKKEGEERLQQSFDRLSDELRAGELVGLFPEGALTSDGQMQPFRPGIERIVQRDPVPVIPIAFNGLWGSWFSRKGGSAMKKVPRRFWSRVIITIGAPVPAAEATAERLQSEVRTLWERYPDLP